MAAAAVLPVGAALVATSPGASAAPAISVNCSAASLPTSTTDLQTMIDNANPGTSMTVTGTCYGSYTIAKNLTLRGQGTAVLNGQGSGTTLTVLSGATVQLDRMTVTGGNASSSLGADGGGINNSGILTLDQSVVDDNSSPGGFGGGIYNNSGATLTLVQTTVSGNRGAFFGGGIYNSNAMTLQGSTVSDNSASAGGGIFTGFGFSPVTLKDTSISGNTATAGDGGGLFNILDSVTLVNSSINGNTTSLAGGGINNNAGTATLDDSTVTNNTAQSAQPGSSGGGVFDFSAITLLNNSNVSRNSPDNCDPPGTVTGCTG